MLGLVAVAAMALTAMLGVGSASATTKLCKTTTNPCTEPYGTGTVIEASSTKALLTNSISNISCTGSAIKGKTTSAGGGAGTETTVLGTIELLNFTGCSTASGTKCNDPTVLNLPYFAELHTTTEGKVNDNGLMTVTSSGKGNPGATVVCGFLINCTFTTSQANIHISGGTSPIAHAEGIALERSGGFCPSFSFWDATYNITTPKPLYVI